MDTAKKTSPKLSAAAKKWRDSLVKEYQITDKGGLAVLEIGAQAFDRLQECRAEIEADGCTVRDKFNQIKPHPLLSCERDSRAQVMQALKILNLNFEVE